MRMMKMLVSVAVMLLATTAAVAGDFEWLKELNIRAEKNLSGYSAELATRFKIGETEVKAVIGKVDRPADAYMVLRLGEMTKQPTSQVLETYQAEKGQGWGKLAKSLGIKPGSREFHALKRGHDLNGGNAGGDEGGKGKGKGRGRGRGRD